MGKNYAQIGIEERYEIELLDVRFQELDSSFRWSDICDGVANFGLFESPRRWAQTI